MHLSELQCQALGTRPTVSYSAAREPAVRAGRATIWKPPLPSRRGTSASEKPCLGGARMSVEGNGSCLTAEQSLRGRMTIIMMMMMGPGFRPRPAIHEGPLRKGPLPVSRAPCSAPGNVGAKRRFEPNPIWSERGHDGRSSERVNLPLSPRAVFGYRAHEGRQLHRPAPPRVALTRLVRRFAVAMVASTDKFTVTYTHRKKQRDRQKDGELHVLQALQGSKKVRVAVHDEEGREVESGDVDIDQIQPGGEFELSRNYVYIDERIGGGLITSAAVPSPSAHCRQARVTSQGKPCRRLQGFVRKGLNGCVRPVRQEAQAEKHIDMPPLPPLSRRRKRPAN
eukprot:scaffold866_cov544-Prasinococcus_capsulatus_cf.AAC.12